MVMVMVIMICDDSLLLLSLYILEQSRAIYLIKSDIVIVILLHNRYDLSLIIGIGFSYNIIYSFDKGG